MELRKRGAIYFVPTNVKKDFNMLKKIIDIFSGNRIRKNLYSHRCILIVDDNELDRTVIRSTLEKLGCRILLAENGEIGYQIAVTEKPDLILSDCRMPHMDGIEMFKRIKKHAETKNIPFIYLTGVDTPKNIVDCFELGAENYMCKPINRRLLTSQIEMILKEHFPS
jgi:response regulator RpfG family c-di-GMP phosphodiesterase